MSTKPKIPIIIVTGFLGSGKTTLINNMLEQNKETRFAIIENEVGEISIDSKLLKGLNKATIIELNNGCICCTIHNEFSLTLQELLKNYTNIDQLLIETTGIANPQPIINEFYHDQELKRLFELKGTICMVDTPNILSQRKEFEQKTQILFADMIIMNKTNKVGNEQIEEVRKHLISINNTASLLETNFANIDSSCLELLNSQFQEDFIKKIRKPLFSEHGLKEFHTFSIRFKAIINGSLFSEWFKYFAYIHKNDIYRIKGVVIFEENPFLITIQSVGGACLITEGPVINPFEINENILVFIGKKISKFEIENQLMQFINNKN